MPDGREVSVLELLVSSVVDYAIFALDVDGTVATWNAGARRLKGYEADEIVGRHFSTFYTEEDRRAGVPEAGLRAALEEGRWESEGWRVRKDGTRFWANVVITVLRADDGRLQGFAKVTRDLTERKLNEDALRSVLAREREAAEQLRTVDRMRRELVTMVAHDLRGPITVVQNLLDLLLDHWDEIDDDERRHRVERAGVRAGMLASLTDDVFDIALIDAGRLDVAADTVDVGEVVQQVVDDALDTGVVGGPEVVCDLEPGLLALGDQQRIWQIVGNVVSNATMFAPAGSTVTVTGRRRGDDVVVSVHNVGPGIPLPDQERIFQRFVRLRRSERTPGSGLGLFIARSLAEAQGGSLELVSSDDAGTTFSLHLPAGGA